MIDTVEYDQNVVDELQTIAARLHQLELHDEGNSLLRKAKSLKAGKPVLSEWTLQQCVDKSDILEALKNKLQTDFPQKDKRPYGRSNDGSVMVLEVLMEALVEVVRLANGSLDTDEARKLTCHSLNIPLSWMDYVDAFARAEGRLLPRDGSGMLKLS